MKLIAESNFENQLLPGLVSLLRDLRVDACGFFREEAIAPVFWSSDDFSTELSSMKRLSKDELTAILCDLEPDMQDAMILAGFQVIEKYLQKANGSQVYQHHRYS